MQSQLNFYWKCFLSRGAEIEGGTQQRRPSEGSGDSHTCPQHTPTTGHWLLQNGSSSLTVNIFQTLVSYIVLKKKQPKKQKNPCPDFHNSTKVQDLPLVCLSTPLPSWCAWGQGCRASTDTPQCSFQHNHSSVFGTNDITFINKFFN